MAVKIKCNLHNYFCIDMVDNSVHVCTKQNVNLFIHLMVKENLIVEGGEITCFGFDIYVYKLT